MTTGDFTPAKAPAQRVGYRERDEAVERLRTALGEGQITLDELETRMEAALEARTAGDLAVLLADLPAPTGPAALAVAPVPPSVRLAASHGHVERLGSWRVPPEVVLELRHAVGTLDLRTPSLPPGGVHIVVQGRHSAIKILVGEGTPVDLGQVGCHHGQATDRHARRVAAWVGPPVVITGDLHHSAIKILRPYNSWWLRFRQRRQLTQRRALP